VPTRSVNRRAARRLRRLRCGFCRCALRFARRHPAHVLDLSAALARRGHHVAFAGTPGEWLDERRDANFLALDLEGVAQHGGADQRVALPARIVNAFKAAARLRAFVRRERIGLIHAHESAPALVAWLATKGLAEPTLVTYHGSEPERVAGFARIARVAATRVITPSWRCAEELRRVGGIAAAKVQVIGLGIEPRPPVDDATRQRVRSRHLGADGRRLVVTIARLAHQKGIDVLIDVARELRSAARMFASSSSATVRCVRTSSGGSRAPALGAS
jgi:glycosyltransferase involved in cell wall biosynthesis